MSTEQFTFFYGGPFSNWLTCEFEVDGHKFVSTEQHMMYEKAMLFGDKEAAERILKTRDPQKAKIIGRGVKGLKGGKWDADDIALWNSKSRDFVYKGNYAKFTQNEGLKHALLETKGTTLVEASPTDQIWGIGWDADDEEAQSRDTWRGTNWLGEVLTKVRDDIEAGVYTTENFNWSDGSVSILPVKITNNTGTDLWIWDNDKIRRWASELGNQYTGLRDVEVIVGTKDGFGSEAVTVKIVATREDGTTVLAHAESFTGEVLKTFKSALLEINAKLQV